MECCNKFVIIIIIIIIIIINVEYHENWLLAMSTKNYIEQH